VSCPDELPDICAIPVPSRVSDEEIRSALIVAALSVEAAQSRNKAADGEGTDAALRAARASVDRALRLLIR